MTSKISPLRNAMRNCEISRINYSSSAYQKTKKFRLKYRNDLNKKNKRKPYNGE